MSKSSPEVPSALIDLHTHLRGTFSPKSARKMARKNKAFLSESIFGYRGYAFNGFQEFLSVYDQVGSVVREPQDLEDISFAYLKRCAAEGGAYVEFMLSPDHSVDNGIPLPDQLDAVQNGIERARHDKGIEATVVITAVRHRGGVAATELAEAVADLGHPIVSGFGLTGNELLFDIADFAPAFYIMGSEGYGLTAHIGEWSDAKAVMRAVDILNLSRVGHGLSAANDSGVLNELANRQIAIEVCLSSNKILGRWSDISTHPMQKMLAANCKVTLATDDPAYFNTSISTEYELAWSALDVSGERLEQVTLDAIDAAFCSEETKIKLRSRSATPPPPAPLPPAPATAPDTAR